MLLKSRGEKDAIELQQHKKMHVEITKVGWKTRKRIALELRNPAYSILYETLQNALDN